MEMCYSQPNCLSSVPIQLMHGMGTIEVLPETAYLLRPIAFLFLKGQKARRWQRFMKKRSNHVDTPVHRGDISNTYIVLSIHTTTYHREVAMPSLFSVCFLYFPRRFAHFGGRV